MQAIWNATDPQHVKSIVNQIVKQFDNTGSVTLTNGTTTTIVTNPKVNSQSVVTLIPTTLAAKAEYVDPNGATVTAKGNGTFTITHLNAATTRKFDYVIFGI